MERVLRKLASPRDLAAYLRYKLVHGNEYLYFDLVDSAPRLGSVLGGLVPRRVDFSGPVFLTSLRRSGSTLFYRVMNSHPDLFLYNERFPGDRMRGRGQPTDRNIWSVEDRDELLAVVRRYLGPTVRLRYRRWGVKLSMELAHPHPGSISAGNLERLTQVFPEAKFLWLVRDPRDFVLSSLKRMGHDTTWWIREYRAMIALLDRMLDAHSDRFLVTRYEDLVTGAEEATRACCEFVGLDYLNDMLEPKNWSSKGPRAYEAGAIVSQVAKWTRATGRDLATVKEVGRAVFPAASKFGYDPGS